MSEQIRHDNPDFLSWVRHYYSTANHRWSRLRESLAELLDQDGYHNVHNGWRIEVLDYTVEDVPTTAINLLDENRTRRLSCIVDSLECRSVRVKHALDGLLDSILYTTKRKRKRLFMV